MATELHELLRELVIEIHVKIYNKQNRLRQTRKSNTKQDLLSIQRAIANTILECGLNGEEIYQMCQAVIHDTDPFHPHVQVLLKHTAAAL